MECIWAGPALLGEGPVWHVAEQVLYWIDCVKPALYRYDPQTGNVQEFAMPAIIGCVAPRAKGGLIAAIGDGLGVIEIEEGQAHVVMQANIVEDKRFRLNDGKCDRQGRFWVGSVCPDMNNPNASLYRCDPDGQIKVMQKQVGISNGMAWSLNNRIFYYTDSLARCIYKYDFDAATGDISHRKVLVELGEVVDGPQKVPDGCTLDSKGYLWSAIWNGSKIVCYKPNGKIDREIKMPCLRPTSCMFGGPNLDILFVTSCSRDFLPGGTLGYEEEALPPPAGSVFALDVGVRGVEEPAYLG